LTPATDIREGFRNAGFEVTAARVPSGALIVKKNGCSQQIWHDSSGKWVPVGPPSVNVRGLDCRLEDQGYQKFWLHEGKRFPVRVSDLRLLHRFDQEVRALLGLRSLYHESLGTTSARTVYDRLTERTDSS
jgi:hypothetical protein